MPIALITGGSRGIGLAAAVALGKAGFDVALAARTALEGEGRDDGDFSDGQRVISGSLAEAQRLVAATGARVLVLPFDLRDHASIESVVKDTVEHFGRLDVLVNNALDHQANNLLISQLTHELIQQNILSNLAGPLIAAMHALDVMTRQKGGRIINLISVCAYTDPLTPVGAGGWGVLYGMTKGGLQRMAGVVKAESGDSNILCYSLDPGFVKTAVVGNMPLFADAAGDHPPEVPAAVIQWLASSDEAKALNGQTLIATELIRDRNLPR
jgi:NAD(P)-dependent dehydrogenase (short-subunit alcohol dehydrogenase family)